MSGCPSRLCKGWHFVHRHPKFLEQQLRQTRKGKLEINTKYSLNQTLVIVSSLFSVIVLVIVLRNSTTFEHVDSVCCINTNDKAINAPCLTKFSLACNKGSSRETDSWNFLQIFPKTRGGDEELQFKNISNSKM